MTDAQRAEAQRYGRLSLVCTLLDMALDFAFLALFAGLAARPLDDALKAIGLLDRVATLRLAVLYLAMTAAHALVSLPLSFYSGHWLERQFALSTRTWPRWLWDYVKRLGLAGGLGLGLILGLYWLIWTTGHWWWLTAAGAAFVVSVVLGQWMPVVILPLFYPIKRLEQPELEDRLARLAEGTGLTLAGVYRMDLSVETVKANAMLAGLGRTRRVLLGDTLLERFSPAEIAVIFAHEIGHHVHRHLPRLMLGGLFSSVLGFWLCDRLLTAFGLTGDYAALPVYTMPWLMLILTAFMTLIGPVQNYVSRRFERQADRYALWRTGDREAYLSAFRKLAVLNKDDPDPPWLEVVLLHSHPPIAERLKLAE